MTLSAWLLLLTITATDGLHTATIPYTTQARCELARTIIIDQANRMIDVKSITATCVPENDNT